MTQEKSAGPKVSGRKVDGQSKPGLRPLVLK
jgi:hypothetical protein